MTVILFLHGGGHSDHTRYIPLQQYFESRGIHSHAFDHLANSLAGRLAEAEIGLDVLKSKLKIDDSQVIVWGSSMGAHVACRLLETHPGIKALILQSPAAYSQSAENIPFGPEFTDALHMTRTWTDSLAFKALKEYRGKVLIMFGEHDDVMPQEVQDLYRIEAEKSGEFHILPRGAHSLLRPTTPVAKKVWERMAQTALNFLLKI